MIVVLTVEGDRVGSEEQHFNRALMMSRPSGLVFFMVFYAIGLCLSYVFEVKEDRMSCHVTG